MVLRIETAIWTITLAAALVVPAVVPAPARDQDEARRAVEAGEARPLSEILDMVRGKISGEIVRVKIERKSGLWMYELRVVDGKGRLLEVHVDARSGDVMRIKEK